MLHKVHPSLSPEAATITVRPARISDLPVLVDLLCQLFSIETDFEVRPDRHGRGLRLLMGAARSGRAYVAVAERQKEVVGMATVQAVVSTAEGAPSGWIEDVIVRKDLRGWGIGTSLMAAIAQWAQAKGIARLQLLADHRNRLALTFYSQLHFQSTHMVCLRAGSPRTQPLATTGKGRQRQQ